MEVYGTDGTQDTPRKWEGFGEYKLVYRLRNEGLDYLGNDTVVRNYTRTDSRTSVSTRIASSGHKSVAQVPVVLSSLTFSALDV